MRYVASSPTPCCRWTSSPSARGSGTLPRNALAITFDDGYRDNLTHAAPDPSSPAFPPRSSSPRVHRHRQDFLVRSLALALKLTKVATVRTPWGETLVLRDRTARLAALDRAQNRLKTLGDDELQRALDVLLEGLDVPDAAAPKNLMLDWADARALTGLGFDVGGHTVSHVIFSRVTADGRGPKIQGSRSAIEAGLGSRPTAFAYPNGRAADYTPATVELVRDAGFAWAVTTLLRRHGPNAGVRASTGWPREPDVATFALKLAVYRATRG